MFEKISQLAEAAATHVSLSRRGFLGRLGQGALAVGALRGSFTAAQAGGPGVVCCKYTCRDVSSRRRYEFIQCYASGTTCPSYGLCTVKSTTANDCTDCK
jgi:hypothetical protein